MIDMGEHPQPLYYKIEKVRLAGRDPSSEWTPTASAASLGHESLQAASRDTRFARYCEETSLADASILSTTTHYLL